MRILGWNSGIFEDGWLGWMSMDRLIEYDDEYWNWEL